MTRDNWDRALEWVTLLLVALMIALFLWTAGMVLPDPDVHWEGYDEPTAEEEP